MLLLEGWQNIMWRVLGRHTQALERAHTTATVWYSACRAKCRGTAMSTVYEEQNPTKHSTRPTTYPV